MDIAVALSPATARFAARRERILDVGARLINEQGLKGLSLGAVAEEIGIGGSSVTYYFRRKDLLAAACYHRALDALEAQVAAAAAAPDVRARVERLVLLSVADAGDREGGSVLSRLNEMRAMAEPHRTELVRRYFSIFRVARDFWPAGEGAEARILQIMRAHVLMETCHTLPSWLRLYAEEEHPRVAQRTVTLLTHGLAPVGAVPVAAGAAPGLDEGAEPRDRFLGAATRLINERGYRGASVERIASALNVTKGSFYHHLDAKDDLVLACLRRSLRVVGRAVSLAAATPGTALDRIAAVLGTLVAVQLGDGTPLLRFTALAALPREFRQEAVSWSERAARRFAGVVIDGITEGSVRAVDPLIAGELALSMLNVAYELRNLRGRLAPERAVALYGSTLLEGIVPR